MPSNIVKGCARSPEAEYIHFLDTAYGSARESSIKSDSRIAFDSPSDPPTKNCRICPPKHPRF